MEQRQPHEKLDNLFFGTFGIGVKLKKFFYDAFPFLTMESKYNEYNEKGFKDRPQNKRKKISTLTLDGDDVGWLYF